MTSSSGGGRYMAYSPSPSSAPLSPHLFGLRSVSSSAAILAEQEKYLSELLGERHKLGPFLSVLPNCCRLLNQDPSRRRLPVGEWRTIVDNAIVIYNANVKNKSRKSITWKPLSGIPPQQGRGCGLWVMLYMNDIVKDKNLGFATKWEVRKGRKQQVYTATEIDAVRNEWANYVTSIQFVK